MGEKAEVKVENEKEVESFFGALLPKDGVTSGDAEVCEAIGNAEEEEA
jgi:hypothetical protein